MEVPVVSCIDGGRIRLKNWLLLLHLTEKKKKQRKKAMSLAVAYTQSWRHA